MFIRTLALILTCSPLAACATDRSPATRPTSAAPGDTTTTPPAADLRVSATQPLAFGDTFTIDSRILGEARRVNVLVPTVYGTKIDAPMPVLYMPDGGLDEDFPHVAGLVQVLVNDAVMRPFVLVGIPNTQRRRDLTGPTTNPEDRAIAPVVGGSGAFRRFLKEELMPTVRARYRTTDESAIVGESLAGLFVVETFFVEPDLFETYIAIDPSLWWNHEELVKSAAARLAAAPFTRPAPPAPGDRLSLFVAHGNEPGIAKLAAQLAGVFHAHPPNAVEFRYAPLPAETHATIYHPAAMQAFRAVFAPPPEAPK